MEETNDIKNEDQDPAASKLSPSESDTQEDVKHEPGLKEAVLKVELFQKLELLKKEEIVCQIGLESSDLSLELVQTQISSLVDEKENLKYFLEVTEQNLESMQEKHEAIEEDTASAESISNLPDSGDSSNLALFDVQKFQERCIKDIEIINSEISIRTSRIEAIKKYVAKQDAFLDMMENIHAAALLEEKKQVKDINSGKIFKGLKRLASEQDEEEDLENNVPSKKSKDEANNE